MFNVEVIRITALICIMAFSLVMILRYENKILLFFKTKFGFNISYIMTFLKIILVSVSLMILFNKGHINSQVKDFINVEFCALGLAIIIRVDLALLYTIFKNSNFILILLYLAHLDPLLIIGSLIIASYLH